MSQQEQYRVILKRQFTTGSIHIAREEAVHNSINITESLQCHNSVNTESNGRESGHKSINTESEGRETGHNSINRVRGKRGRS